MISCPLASFIEEKCDLVHGFAQPAAPLMAAFREFCVGRGLSPLRDRDIAVLLETHGFFKRKTSDLRLWMGVRLKPAADGTAPVF